MMQSPGTESKPSEAVSPAAPPRRRRLWQLPAEHRACVVGLGVPPSVLRRAVEQALTRLPRVRVELTGSDADLLASVLCDLGSRNAVSEAVQDLLDLRHAAAGARVAGWREPEALREAWRAALGGGDVPGLLWALLTHPLGESLQDALAVDARGWVFERARAGQAAYAAEARTQHDIATQRAGADALRHRLQAQQAAFDAERQALAQKMARLRGECDALRAVPLAGPDSGSGRCPAPVSGPELARALATKAPVEPPAEPVAPSAVAEPSLRAPPSLRGRRVLCVGGMPGAQARYRQLVESAGAQFDYHDGGLERGLHRLDRQLGTADLVVCQAGCLNHEAYRRVKGHCRAATKTCLFVERPSIAHFARTLGLAAEPGART